jgi:hypothetical protein
MFAKLRLTASALLLAVVAASVMVFGCSKSQSTPQQIAEQAPAPPSTQPSTQPAQPPNVQEIPPPKLEEVKQAVKRVFKTAVVIAEDRTPGFLVGDFNGDLSQDLAAIVKPGEGNVSELNQEFPSWIAREPIKDVLVPKSKAMARQVADRPSANPASGQTIRFEQDDVLVAIIHGTGVNGWRDPEATQTHLLRDVVGTNMKMLTFKGAVKAYSGIKPFPTIYGDLIQQTLIGQAGFLYFAGGIYAWYDAKNYSPTAAPVHARMSSMR